MLHLLVIGIIGIARTEMNEYADRIIHASKALKRGGNLLIDTFKNRTSYVLSGKEALDLYNTFGIRIENLCLLIWSHECGFDEQEFLHLLDKQRNRITKCAVCNGKKDSDKKEKEASNSLGEAS